MFPGLKDYTLQSGFKCLTAKAIVSFSRSQVLQPPVGIV